MKARLIEALAVAVVFTLIGCAAVHWQGKPGLIEDQGWSAAEIKTSTVPPSAYAVPISTAADEETDYYADLGPAEIDVSRYPAQQRYNYALFKQTCGACHSLARAINSPTESRLYWRFHLARMKLHYRWSGYGRLDADEVRQILDFLEYDARVRKIEHRKDFERQQERLRTQYDVILEGRLRALQQASPGLLIEGP